MTKKIEETMNFQFSISYGIHGYNQLQNINPHGMSYITDKYQFPSEPH